MNYNLTTYLINCNTPRTPNSYKYNTIFDDFCQKKNQVNLGSLY